MLKTRKDEYLNKESLEELVHCYNDKDAIIFEINGNKYCTEISDVQYFYKLNQNDKITQVIWGLKDFQKRFGRNC